jgi:uncharacterized protein
MISFEWDPEKAGSNLKKHDVSFEIAASIFADPQLVIQFDRIKDGEERWHAIGSAPNGVLFQAVYTWRGSERIRIISARKANQREKSIYYEE